VLGSLGRPVVAGLVERAGDRLYNAANWSAETGERIGNQITNTAQSIKDFKCE
jgi:hypothetical protein